LSNALGSPTRARHDSTQTAIRRKQFLIERCGNRTEHHFDGSCGRRKSWCRGSEQQRKPHASISPQLNAHTRSVEPNHHWQSRRICPTLKRRSERRRPCCLLCAGSGWPCAMLPLSLEGEVPPLVRKGADLQLLASGLGGAQDVSQGASAGEGLEARTKAPQTEDPHR